MSNHKVTKLKRTQICIIGCGPAGLLLSQLLHNAGISSIILDQQSRAHIEARVRAGVLEWESVKTLREAGLSARMDREGLPHDGFTLAFDGTLHRINIKQLTGKQVMIYGQTELTSDMIAHRLEQGGEIIFSAQHVQPVQLLDNKPKVQFEKDGEKYEITSDYIAGCDGFHGISRQTIPKDAIRTFEQIYPFGWLGILVEQPPIDRELIYASHQRGFALCSMRSKQRSRYYIQCPLSERIEDWPDERFWQELTERIGRDCARNLQTGDSFEKSIVPLRSFVTEPMRYGNLFLAGDAAHIVPPTGAKGLNLAMTDVRVLSRAFVEHYKSGNDKYLEEYSAICLKHVWKVERFSWFMSTMLHQFPDFSDFEKRMQRAEFDHIVGSKVASRSLAENYAGLPLVI